MNGELYVDGGARSATNADALVDFPVETAVVVTTPPAEVPIIGEAMGRMLETEVHKLTDAGVLVNVIGPTEREAAAFGFDLLNTGNAPVAVEAGIETGREAAERLTSW